MKVSIALAAYNGERYIEEQLQSFLKQTRWPDEVVIADDASSDRTMEIVRRFQESAPFVVKVLPGRGRQGFVANFNRAIAATTGDLVFLSDQDDVWFTNKIEKMESAAHGEEPAWLFMCDAAVANHDLSHIGPSKLEQFRGAGLSLDRFAIGCCCAIRRELLDWAMPIPVNFRSHDIWFVRMADGLQRKHIVHEVLQYYRRHADNTSGGSTNALAPMTRAGFMRAVFLRRWSGSASWAVDARREAVCLHMLHAGMEEAARKRSGLGAREFEALAARFATLARQLDSRVRLHGMPRPLRIRHVMVVWWRGGYQMFSGWRSALMDLLVR
ncbi:glycosyltransferase family 2 protein [Thioalkalivibrio sp. ALMg13-2]|uniref:glycosyltransferase family 2 protein n=1 Tax=Thioalkalivibrio sp. ALMg13-2 TaxID=1158167 RepID=UPI00035E55CA|nr:glycosyltransferase family 2 protein [Thioalkalivibrio sp. ALMg13-2]